MKLRSLPTTLLSAYTESTLRRSDYATACDCIRLYAVVAVVCDLYIINDNDSDIDIDIDIRLYYSLYS